MAVLFTQVKIPGPRSAKGLRCLQEPKKQRKQDSWGPGGNQEKVCNLAAWALSWERGGLGSLYIKESLDENKNKPKHKVQTARTPGLTECPSQ